MTSYIELRVSKDGGYTWSDWKARDLGATGDFIKPLVWRRLGNARHFTFDFRATGAPDILAGSIMDAMGQWVEAPVVGGAYGDENRPWAFQDTCNYIPVAAEKQGARSMAKLRGAPGERLFANVGDGPIRAARDVEGKLFVVSGTGFYRVFTDTSSTLIGTIPGTGRCTLTHNQEGGGSKVVISNGTIRGWTYDTITEVFAEIDDEAFPGFLSVDYLDQYILGIEPQRRYAFHSDLADARSYSSIDRFESESSPDRLLAQAVNAGQWWLFGERTIDVYANTGAATGTFQRIPGSTIDRGISGTHALAALDNTLFFWGDDGTFYRLNGYTPLRVSTHPIEQAARLCDLSGVFCTVYEDAGHKIVWSTFPDGRTWGYDVASGEWFRRQSYGRQNWRMSTLVKWNGAWLAGDSEQGKLYQVDWAIRDEDGAALIGRRTTGALHNNEQRITVNGVRVLVDTGREGSLPTGPGDIIDPLVIFNPLPTVYVDVAVSHNYRSSGGVLPHVFSITAGSLPAGLSMDADGLVTGTPTTQATYAWRVQVLDAQGFTATLDQGQDAELGIDGDAYSVGYAPPTLFTSVKSYDGDRDALALDAAVIPFTTAPNLVSACPGGLYAAASVIDSFSAGYFQLLKWDALSGEWDVLPSPADMPVLGPRGMAWSADGEYLALAIGDNAPNNVLVYKRTGDTFTQLDPPSEFPTGPCLCVAWDSVGQRIAFGANSGGYVYDFVAEEMIGQREFNASFVAQTLDFLPGAGSRYLACGNADRLYVAAVEEEPVRITNIAVTGADAGAYWDASGSYLFVIGELGTNSVAVWNFDGSVILSETLTLVGLAADQPGTAPSTASLSSDRLYLALSRITSQSPVIYESSETQPPVLTMLSAPAASGSTIVSVSWTGFVP